MTRIRISLLIVTVILLGGCLGFVQGTAPLSFEATPATVPDNVLTEAEYGNETVNNANVNWSFEIRNTTREVNVENWNVEYQKQGANGGLQTANSRFTTFSTPQFSIAGRALNPVSNMTNEELLDHVLGDNANLENVSTIDEQTITVLDENASVTTFNATVRGGSGSLVSFEQELYIHMMKVNHNGDTLLAVGVHPKSVDERENILRLMKGLQHGSQR